MGKGGRVGEAVKVRGVLGYGPVDGGLVYGLPYPPERIIVFVMRLRQDESMTISLILVNSRW